MSTWGGLPVVHELRRAAPRTRVQVTGYITDARPSRYSGGRAFVCDLDDGTGTVELVFTGRLGIAGLGKGSHCHVEGTVQDRDGDLVVMNPIYELIAQ